MAAASVIDQPNVTAGTTTDGLTTANAAATRSPGACPSRDPRLQKYAGPSGSATPFRSAGLGEKPSCTYSAWHSGEKYTCPAKGSITAASLLAFALSSSSSIMGLSVVASTEWQLAERVAVSEIARVGDLKLGPDIRFQRGGQAGDVGVVPACPDGFGQFPVGVIAKGRQPLAMCRFLSGAELELAEDGVEYPDSDARVELQVSLG